MKIKQGTYTGDGNDDRTITIEASWGNPDFVFILSDSAAEGVWKTSDMAGDTAFLIANNGALTANLIQAFGDGTFQIGDDAKVNNLNDEYYYLAIQDTGGGEFDVETYVGDGGAGALTKDFNCGYTPDICFIHGDDAAMKTYYACGDMAANNIYDFTGALHTNKFNDFAADGFTIQNHAQVNTNAETYYCIIIKEVNGVVNSGSYVGNATDDRSIAVTGFSGITGDFVWVGGGSGDRFNGRSTDMGADNTCSFYTDIAAANKIQALESGGFQLGGANAVNRDTYTFYFSEFKDYAAAGGAELEKSLSDTINLSDIYAASFGLPKADGINLSDVITKNFGVPKADTVSLSDGIAKNVGLPEGDTITLSDFFSSDAGGALLFIIEQLGLNPMGGIY